MKGMHRKTIGFFLAAVSSFTYSMDIRVTKFSDSYDGICSQDCSLREAVQLANENPGEDRILLNAGTYRLEIPVEIDIENDYEIIDEDMNANGDLDITDDVTIQGAPGNTTIIDAVKNHRAFENVIGKSELINLSIRNGVESAYGGAIENYADLTLRYCQVMDSKVSGWDSKATGGGIANFGTLKVYSSLITRNVSNGSDSSFGPGGGIYNEGTLVIRDSTISYNEVQGYDGGGVGGGVFNSGKADIRRSLFHRNTSSTFGTGSAVFTGNGGTLKMSYTTISDNDDGVDDWEGGAVANGAAWEFTPGKLYLTNVTIADNRNYGLVSRGETHVRNSIIAGNANVWTGTARNCKRASGTIELDDVIMGYEQNDTTCYPNTNLGIANTKTFTTLLEPLADNGGPTLTHALRKNSIAIDKGKLPCATYDQRGMTGIQDGDNDGVSICDIGAFEYSPPQ